MFVWNLVVSRVANGIIDALTAPAASPKTNYGPQVDAWGAYVPMQGHLETDLQDRVIRKMKAKGLIGLNVIEQKLRFHDPSFTGGGGAAQEHIIFIQDLGNGGKAAFALRIARRGLQDLGISWHLFERNARAEQYRAGCPIAAVPIILFLMGLLVLSSPGNFFDASILYDFLVMIICLSVALVLLVFGLFGVVRMTKGASSVSTNQHIETLILGETVCHALMLSLQELGVDRTEVRVVQNAQITCI